MLFLEKVLPEAEHRIRKQFLNELVPNYYSNFFLLQSDLIMFKKSWKSDFQLKNPIFRWGWSGVFCEKNLIFFWMYALVLVMWSLWWWWNVRFWPTPHYPPPYLWLLAVGTSMALQWQFSGTSTGLQRTLMELQRHFNGTKEALTVLFSVLPM